jgi:hypothetical protein
MAGELIGSRVPTTVVRDGARLTVELVPVELEV